MLLEVDIEKRFSAFHCRFDFSLDHQHCGVFGPSGSGKSSLMSMLAGLMRPDQGTIRLNGVPLFDSATHVNQKPEARKIGVVFQHAHLFPHFNVRKNLFYGYTRTPHPKRTIDPEKVIAILHLEHLIERGVGKLSGGERQRVALGRAILACPDLILLDEPLTGLDDTLKYQIIPELRQVFDEFSVPMLFISHDLQEMRMLTEEVLVLHNGSVETKMATEMLARAGFVNGGPGYINLLDLDQPEDTGDLLKYKWGGVELMLVKSQNASPGRFTLGSRDILLFKKHPQAASARNMLHCTIRNTYETAWLIGVELDCQGNSLIAEVVPQSVEELDIRPGKEIVAVFKASAFRKLY
jgi:molybdate transport system ATP-binding protein